ncbi:MAG: hypothetical protein DELT_02754 [Desulfovibrio sp.]
MKKNSISTSNVILGYLAVISTVVYLSWRLFFTLPLSYGVVAVILGLLLFSCEFISGLQTIAQFLGQIRPMPLERPEIPDSWFPEVDVFIPTHGEDVNILYNTLNACQYMEYPDKSKVHVHLCDDMNRPEMRALAAQMGVNYITMTEPRNAKAGNLNNALAQTGSELVAVLDADMIPKREFLMHLVPYFFLPRMTKNSEGQWRERTAEEIDPTYKIGFVQSPQNFYNPDLFQFNLYAEQRVPNEQMYFFRELNVNRNRTNSTTMCGSNMVISRKALEEVGLFATNNITEDHETGIKIQTAGYTTYAISECLASGLTPPTVEALLRQRERWGRGCMQTMHNIKPLTDSRIPLATRAHYFCNVLYWLTFTCRYFFIITPILVALFSVFVLECSVGEILIFWLPYYVLHAMAISRLSSRTRTVHWENTVDTILFPFLVVPVLLEICGIRLKRFKVTEKAYQKNTSASSMLALPHMILFGLSVVGIGLCLLSILQHGAVYNFIILFWLVANAKSLLMAIFFMLGRTNHRGSHRFSVAVSAEVEFNGYIYQGATVDVSEGGASISLDFPAWLPQDKPVTLRLSDRGYHATMLCTVVQVNKTKAHEWVYSMKLEQIDEDQRSQYRQIIYDRDPSLPEAINDSMLIIEDIKVNIDKRLVKESRMLARKSPRIWQSIEGKLPDGRAVRLEDFGYQYVSAALPFTLGDDETVNVVLAPGIILQLARAEEYLTAQRRGLCRIVNWRDWVQKREYMEFLSRWSGRAMPETARWKDAAHVDSRAPWSGREVLDTVPARVHTPWRNAANMAFEVEPRSGNER